MNTHIKKSFFLLLAINLILLIKNKTLIALFTFIFVIQELIILIVLIKSNSIINISKSFINIKSIWFIFLTLIYGTCLIIISYKLFRNHIDNGLLNLERHSGITKFKSFFVRYVVSLILLCSFIIINLIINFLTIIILKENILFFVNNVIQIYFYISIFTIVIYPLICFLSICLKNVVTIITKFLLVFILSLSPSISKLIENPNNIYSINNLYYNNISKVNLKYSLSYDFQKIVKRSFYLNDILNDNSPFENNLNIFQSTINNLPTNNSKQIKSDLLTRVLFLGQSNLLDINNEKIIGDWKISQLILEPVFEISKNYNSKVNYNEIYDHYFFSGIENLQNKKLNKFDDFIYYLLESNLDLSVKEIIKYVSFVYERYYYLISNIPKISIFPILSLENNSIFDNSLDEDYFLGLNREILQIYKSKPEIMIFNYIILQLYNYSINFDFQEFIRIIEQSDFFSNEDSYDYDFVHYLNWYNENNLSINKYFNLNLFNTFSIYYYKNSGNTIDDFFNTNSNFSWLVGYSFTNNLNKEFYLDAYESVNNSTMNSKTFNLFNLPLTLNVNNKYLWNLSIILISTITFNSLFYFYFIKKIDWV
ncbi:hypothetical protein STURO_v1c03300 [Spiroplasma turonicum]|nr:hypothetical protein STURO_v1c03300 [Spiroplasma turonicum]